MPQYNLNTTTIALQNNPQMRADLVAYLQQNGDNRSPEQWLMDDLNSGDTNSSFLDAVNQASQVAQPTSTPSGTTPTNTDGGGLNMSALVNAGTQPAIQVPTITNPAVSPGGTNGYSQNQVGGQTGGYTSVGGSNSQQSGTQTTDTTQNQTGTQNTSNTGTNAGTQSNVGTTSSTTGVNAPFDIGALVNSQLGTSGAADTQRSAFLNDVMQTGGSQFGSQVDQAVRSSLSGPQMSGAGDSARARAAGYAGAQVARNNLDQRLGAASQLGNANSNVNATLGATSPLYGQTSTGTNSNTGTSNNTSTNTGTNTSSSNSTGTSNQMNLQNLVSNEGQAGTATGSSVQQGFGVSPQGQTQKSGGCVVCTAYVARKEMNPGAVRRACEYKKRTWAKYGTSLAGYLLVGPYLSRAVTKSNLFAKIFRPTARAILYHEVYLSAPTRLPYKPLAAFQHAVFHYIFLPVGLVMKLLDTPVGVRCKTTQALLVSQNLNFSL